MKYAHFIGRLGRDWEAKQVGQNTVFENSMAVRSGKDGKETLWVKLAQWGDKPGAILQQYTAKGSMLAVHGDIDVRAWDKSGTPQAELSCRMSSFEFIGGQTEKPTQERQQTLTSKTDQEDDIPF